MLDPSQNWGFRYEYTLKDHLGNGRVFISDLNNDGVVSNKAEAGEVLQEAHYYPFGMQMDGMWNAQSGDKNLYLYNGKELNEEFGLGWNDYVAQFYDASVGRWYAIDSLAGNYKSYSTYNYVLGNPMIFFDPDGRSVSTDFYNLKGKKVKHVEDGKNDKKIVLTNSRRTKKVDKNISDGNTVPLLSNSEISSIDNAYKRTETDNDHEEGFVGGKDENGKAVTQDVEITRSLEETNDGRGIHEDDMNSAINSLESKNATLEYGFHTHPEKDVEVHSGTKIGGIPQPSGGDLEALKTHGFNYGIVGGYNKGKAGGNGGGDIRMLNFYTTKKQNIISLPRYKKIANKVN